MISASILLFICILLLTHIAVNVSKMRILLSVPKEKPTETPVAVTRGSYAPVATSSNLDSPVGISDAKTPQLIEFESEQELLKQNQSLGR